MAAESGEYLNYLDRLQQPGGWFDMVQIVVRMMARNAPPQVCRSFLEDTGRELAKRYPMPETRSLSALAEAFNVHLGHFSWGFVEISDHQTFLLVHHRYLPADRSSSGQEDWLMSFSSVLCGMYDEWFHQTGAPYTIRCRIERVTADAQALFRLERNH